MKLFVKFKNIIVIFLLLFFCNYFFGLFFILWNIKIFKYGICFYKIVNFIKYLWIVINMG